MHPAMITIACSIASLKSPLAAKAHGNLRSIHPSIRQKCRCLYANGITKEEEDARSARQLPLPGSKGGSACVCTYTDAAKVVTYYIL